MKKQVITLASAILIVLTIGCEQDECEPAETRCLENDVQVCCADGYWETQLDCSINDWVCCWDAEYEVHTCLEVCDDN